MGEWIGVTVGVPATNKEHYESDDVLVSGEQFKQGAVCWYNSQSGTWHLSHFEAPSTPLKGVTHWMPLPPPPEDA